MKGIERRLGKLQQWAIMHFNFYSLFLVTDATFSARQLLCSNCVYRKFIIIISIIYSIKTFDQWFCFSDKKAYKLFWICVEYVEKLHKMTKYCKKIYDSPQNIKFCFGVILPNFQWNLSFVNINKAKEYYFINL